MNTTPRTRNLSVLAVATALVALAGPATADLPGTTAPGCLRPSDGTGTNTPAPGQTEGANESSYSTRQRDNGNASQLVPGGELVTNFQPITVSCPGATYTFTVTSSDGSDLGWSTDSTDGTGPAGTTSVSPDGRSVTVTFTGDGSTQEFELTGSTAPAYDNHNLCVGLSMTASHGGLSYTWPEDPAARKVCGPPAGSFYN